MTDQGRFSAADPGFAALTVNDLLARHVELIGRIRLCFGLDAETFVRDIDPLIRNYAACTHLLPATPDNYFREPGGLLSLGLEVAFFSLQGTDAHIFSGRSTISVRRQLEPRWRLATFIGGLCCEFHRLLSHLVVVDEAGREWPAYLGPLEAWLRDVHAERYFVRWKPGATETRGLGLILLPQVTQTRLLQYLNEDNSVVVPHLLASIGGVSTYRDHNVLDGLVRRSLALVIDRNLHADASRYGAPQFGSHLERYLVDAIRRLASDDPAWVPNRDKARVWFGRDGLFLTWPGAAADIVGLLESDQLAGIPKAPDTILDILSGAGVLQHCKDGGPLWRIHPPGGRVPIEAVKLTSTAILIPSERRHLDQLSDHLACVLEDSAPTATTTRPAAIGKQLSLLSVTPAVTTPTHGSSPLPRTHDQVAPSSGDAESGTPLATRPTYALKAPIRLDPSVKKALVDILHLFETANSNTSARTVATGFFVPFSEFESRGIQARLAIRALTQARMLVHNEPDGSATQTHGSGAGTTVGLVVAPSFVDGFDLEAFLTPTAASS